MDDRHESTVFGEEPDATPFEYEAPGVESVMTPEALEREVMYGANSSVPVCAGAVDPIERASLRTA